MNIRRRILIGSASWLALAGASAPLLAAAEAPAPANVAPSDEIVVTGIRASLEKAIAIKRLSDNHVEAISSEDIGKLPDKNVADALQRLPGLNTSSAASGEGGFDENDRVSIRGTSPSLTNVTIDGHSVSTGDWFVLDQFSTVGRSTSFALLPSEIVSSVVVNKTQDASLLEGGVAGSIDLRLRSGLDLKKTWTVEASAQGAYNTQSKEVKPQFNALIGWHNDDNTLGVIVQGFYEERSLRRYGQETLGYSAIAAGSYDSTGKLVGGVTGAAIPSLVGVQAPTLIGSTLFTQQRRREGGVATIDWKPTDKLELKASGFYSNLNASNVNNNYLYWGSRELDRNAPTSYTVKNNTLTAASFPLISSTPNSIYTGSPIEGIVADNIVRPDASAESYFANLDATYHASERLTIKGQIGYTHGVGKTRRRRSSKSMRRPASLTRHRATASRSPPPTSTRRARSASRTTSRSTRPSPRPTRSSTASSTSITTSAAASSARSTLASVSPITSARLSAGTAAARSVPTASAIAPGCLTLPGSTRRYTRPGSTPARLAFPAC